MPFNLKNRDTSPIHTELKETTIAGANLAQSSSFPTKIHDEVFIPKKLKDLCRLFLTKSSKGVISLHQLAPVIRVGHRIVNNKPQISRSLYFIAISCNKNEFDSTQADVHVYKDSTLSMLERGFEADAPFNGFSYNGSPSNGYIPRNLEVWEKPFEGTTLGNYLNMLAMNTFFNIKELQSKLDDSESEVDAEVANTQIQQYWDRYENFNNQMIERGLLVASDFVYVDASSLRPIITCFQDTTSRTQKYLNADFMYGTSEAGASYAPDTSQVVGYGIVTATQAEPDSGYQYGQFSVNSKRGEVTTVAEADKATTLETCTREIAVFDESGRSATMQLTVNDIARGQNPIKRSSNLANLAVGSSLMVTGKLQIRSKGIQGSYACNFRVTEPNWTTVNSASASSVNTDLSMDSLDDLSLDYEADLSSLANYSETDVEENEAPTTSAEDSDVNTGSIEPLDPEMASHEAQAQAEASKPSQDEFKAF